ncbi:MAG: hypothetical protein WAU91_14440 [Desulfatitalea sp.]
MKQLIKRLLTLRLRKRRRFRAKSGVYVVLGRYLSLGKNQVNDIGMGGLSFYYIENGARVSREQQTLTLLTDGPTSAVQIPCRTVGDDSTGELIFPNQSVKRRCVKFERMNTEQKKQLKHLIKGYCQK